MNNNEIKNSIIDKNMLKNDPDAEITYRSVERADLPILCEIAKKAFKFDDFMDDERAVDEMTLNFMGYYYVKSTFCEVAVINGRPEGFIFGLSNTDKKAFMNSGIKISLLPNTIAVKIKSLINPDLYYSFLRQTELYDELEVDDKNDCDGCLELFAISESCRGMGIGSTLLKHLYQHWHDNGAKRIYVLTDNTCDYSFYDNNGFSMVSHLNTEIRMNNEPFSMDVYRYEKDI